MSRAAKGLRGMAETRFRSRQPTDSYLRRSGGGVEHAGGKNYADFHRWALWLTERARACRLPGCRALYNGSPGGGLFTDGIIVR